MRYVDRLVNLFLFCIICDWLDVQAVDTFINSLGADSKLDEESETSGPDLQLIDEENSPSAWSNPLRRLVRQKEFLLDPSETHLLCLP